MIAFIYRLTQWTAIVGGLLLVVLTLMVVTSVVGRALIDVGLGPIPGDFELLEAGIGIAVFFFLPWCYVRYSHATVDLLYMHMPRWFQRSIDIFSALLMLAVWVVLTWMLWAGMMEKKEYMETTFILLMPVWWAYAFCVVGALVGCLCYAARALTVLGIFKEPDGWAPEGNTGH